MGNCVCGTEAWERFARPWRLQNAAKVAVSQVKPQVDQDTSSSSYVQSILEHGLLAGGERGKSHTGALRRWVARRDHPPILLVLLMLWLLSCLGSWMQEYVEPCSWCAYLRVGVTTNTRQMTQYL